MTQRQILKERKKERDRVRDREHKIVPGVGLKVRVISRESFLLPFFSQ